MVQKSLAVGKLGGKPGPGSMRVMANESDERRAVGSWLKARKRDLHIVLVGLGCGPVRPRGAEGVAALGHRAYVGREWDAMGALQFRFLREQGLRPDDVLCDVGCGALRAGRYFVPYLDRGHYLGLDAVPELVASGLECEVEQAVAEDKRPEFVISEHFEFERFSRRATVALAVSLFTHLTGDDIVTCLTRLGRWMGTGRPCYATFFQVPGPVRNYRHSHPHLGFHYTFAEMAAFGARSGWESEYVGDWGDHVGGQMLIRYVCTGRESGGLAGLT